jgi:hypothetical protein
MDTNFPFSAAFGIIADTCAADLEYYIGAKGIYGHILQLKKRTVDGCILHLDTIASLAAVNNDLIFTIAIGFF